MGYIRAYQAMPIFDGMPVTFKSPASCSDIEGLKVYYPAGESTEVATFALADAHGNNVGSIDLFAADVLVKVILDTEKGMAYVQNADTNAYLEGRFKTIEDALGAGGGTGSGSAVLYTAQTLNAAQQAQARTNIDAVSLEQFTAALGEVDAALAAMDEVIGGDTE